jgi:hypothetical protein
VQVNAGDQAAAIPLKLSSSIGVSFFVERARKAFMLSKITDIGLISMPGRLSKGHAKVSKNTSSGNRRFSHDCSSTNNSFSKKRFINLFSYEKFPTFKK